MNFDCSSLEASLATLGANICPDAALLAAVPAHLHLLETVSSTNQVAWERLPQEAEPTKMTIVIALQQTAGRGQRGHQWSSAVGGLYLSLGLTPDLAVDCAPHLTLCSAWGITAALRQQGIPVGIKWLNDLVINGRKLGGILTETRISQQRIRKAVIGVGINWQNPVPPIGINLQTVLANSDSAMQSPIHSLEALAAVTIAGLLKGYSTYRQQGIDFLLAHYQSLLINLGQAVTIDGKPGTVVGVSSQGALQVELTATPSTSIWLQPGEFSLGYG